MKAVTRVVKWVFRGGPVNADDAGHVERGVPARWGRHLAGLLSVFDPKNGAPKAAIKAAPRWAVSSWWARSPARFGSRKVHSWPRSASAMDHWLQSKWPHGFIPSYPFTPAVAIAPALLRVTLLRLSPLTKPILENSVPPNRPRRMEFDDACRFYFGSIVKPEFSQLSDRYWTRSLIATASMQ